MSPRLIPRLLRRAPRDREGYARDFLATYRAIGSPAYPPIPYGIARSPSVAMTAASIQRGGPPVAAIIAAGDRTPLLRQLRLPTTVIHGAADPLVRPSGGHATAAAIPGAQLVIVPGMGHDLPQAVWPQIIEEIARNASRPTRAPSPRHVSEQGR